MAHYTRSLFTLALATSAFALTPQVNAQSQYKYEYAAPLDCMPDSAKQHDTNFKILNDSQSKDTIQITHMLDQKRGNQSLSGTMEISSESAKSVSCVDIMRSHRRLLAGGSGGFSGFTRISSNVPLMLTATYTIDSAYSKAVNIYPIPQTKGIKRDADSPRPAPQPEPRRRTLDNWTTCDPDGRMTSQSSIFGGAAPASTRLDDPLRSYRRKDRTLHMDRFARSPATFNPRSGEPVIVGGVLVNFTSEYPWMAHLEIALKDERGDINNFNCGGTLIDDQWVMTAAHCVHLGGLGQRFGTSFDLSEINVGLGGLDVRTLQRYKATQTLCHADYNDRTLENDIALIKLDRPVRTQRDVIEIGTLPRSDGDDGVTTGARSYPTGWGTTDNDRLSPKLMKIRLDTTTPSRTKFEAKKDSNYGSVCFGDSGGPTHRQTSDGPDAQKEIIGISSYVVRGSQATPQDPGCRFFGVTSGFTRVSAFLGDIDDAKTICSGDNSGCFD